MAFALKLDYPIALERRHLATHGFKRQPEIIRHRFPRERQIKGQRASGPAHKLERRIPPRDDRQERRDLLTRGLTPENKHPLTRRIQFIKRHLKKTLCDMRRLEHHALKRFLAETAHDEFRCRDNVIGRRFAARTTHKIARKKQANHLRAAILHGLRQGSDPRHHRPNEIHLIPGPDNSLPRFKSAVILYLLESLEFIRLTAGTNRTMADWAILALLRVLGKLIVCH